MFIFGSNHGCSHLGGHIRSSLTEISTFHATESTSGVVCGFILNLSGFVKTLLLQQNHHFVSREESQIARSREWRAAWLLPCSVGQWPLQGESSVCC